MNASWFSARCFGLTRLYAAGQIVDGFCRLFFGLRTGLALRTAKRLARLRATHSQRPA